MGRLGEISLWCTLEVMTDYWVDTCMFKNKSNGGGGETITYKPQLIFVPLPGFWRYWSWLSWNKENTVANAPLVHVTFHHGIALAW